MLFVQRMACFSPSVPRHFLLLWVQKQGQLTHSPQDFYRADYFFCADMDDDWLDKLKAKGLIVYHPSWILECISNRFLMPVSKYVLDGE
ncbi:hypothetical protein K435DRAFT_203641 [Dendrothele bispora CBS 962.96]|uniref:BRCT domain-containing protein n=1 Tax=Dendrothele bispora (strain CBS 962.96) TaxID=1314807 RepID=A0A4S8LTG8_DENBC|nr:hypothetical protein K435DRAFT_203641 [Dendrothele bispora CBS 962.96]